MTQFVKLVFGFALFFWIFPSCSNSRSTSARLTETDALLQTNPTAALDSLAKMDPNSLNESDRAYYNLLLTIASHKNQIQFTSDSIIAASQKWYDRQPDEPYNQARSTFYYGLVLHKWLKDEESACRLIQNALQIMDAHTIKDDKLRALAYANLAVIHDRREQDFLEAIAYYKKAIEMELRLQNSRNAVLNACNLLICLVKHKDYGKAKEVNAVIDSLMDATPGMRFQTLNNAKAIYYLWAENNIDSALHYCRILKPAPSDIGAKENMLSRIYAQRGQLDSAIYYTSESFKHCRPEDSLSHHIYFKQLADYYGQLDNADSSSHYALLAYQSLSETGNQRSAKRILELEKQYETASKSIEVEKIQHHQRLLILSSLFLVFCILGLTILAWIQKRKLRAEQITKSIILASAKTHQNTLSLLRPLTIKRRSTTAEMLQTRLLNITKSIRKSFALNLADAIEENQKALSSKQQEILSTLSGERSKTIYILSELGYGEKEIAEYLCTSSDSVRVLINNNKKYTDPQ